MIDVLYVFKYEPQDINKAGLRLLCSMQSLCTQGVRMIVFNASADDITIPNNVGNVVYKHIPVSGLFNKPKLINFAVKQLVSSNYFLFSDVDLIYQNDYVSRMMQYIQNSNAQYYRVVPYNHNIYQEHYSSKYHELIVLPRHEEGGFAHGNGLIHRDSFMRIRGYNEKFIGYGPEDGEFNCRIEKINKIVYDTSIITAHLWHPHFNRIQEQTNSDIYHQTLSAMEKYSKIEDLQYNGDNWGILT